MFLVGSIIKTKKKNHENPELNSSSDINSMKMENLRHDEFEAKNNKKKKEIPDLPKKNNVLLFIFTWFFYFIKKNNF